MQPNTAVPVPPSSIDVRVRFTLLALEKNFVYYTHDSLDYNVQAFLLSCRLNSYDKRVGFTFACESAETPGTYVDLS